MSVDHRPRPGIAGPPLQRDSVLPIIAAPLADRVFFAGEHTDPRVGPGGMEGAIASAYRVVPEVLAA